ncbi:hypothetical protein LZ24_00632 [Desulfobotulus alkaliphilus]|uniref:Uncharacterized protein n=1 Tax=Desulfobotulus alkaliphilus TaxID=622671 RepID=A0A562S2K8_9BACT|nr:hypothetical protein [Desulfobotulus alkaliphilus]TWI75585.1 hypothetical protein LZ24_00632 [Desulfobotulus alkaliphilus]
MTEKENRRYKVKMACPQCGCSNLTTLSREEIQQRFGDLPNVELDCHECMIKYETARADACPEWDAECLMMQEGKGAS